MAASLGSVHVSAGVGSPLARQVRVTLAPTIPTTSLGAEVMVAAPGI